MAGTSLCSRCGCVRCAPDSMVQELPERLPGMRRWTGANLLRCSFHDNAATSVPGFGTQVDHPIRTPDHFQVVLDDHDRVASINQSLEYSQQHSDVVKV